MDRRRPFHKGDWVRLHAAGVTKRAMVLRRRGRTLVVSVDGVFRPGNGVVAVMPLRQLDDGTFVDLVGGRAVVVDFWTDDDDASG
jgi:hypothetical protein